MNGTFRFRSLRRVALRYGLEAVGEVRDCLCELVALYRIWLQGVMLGLLALFVSTHPQIIGPMATASALVGIGLVVFPSILWMRD